MRDYAILKAHFFITPAYLNTATDLLIVRKSLKTRIKINALTYETNYRKIKDHYHVNNSSSVISFNIRYKRKLASSQYSIATNMLLSEIETRKKEQSSMKSVRQHDIVEEKLDVYNYTFWNNNNIIVPEISLKKAIDSLELLYK